jgi:hypothetical protein
MYLSVTICDTTIEYQDDEPWNKALAIDISNTLIGQTATAYEAGLHLGETPAPEAFG